MRSCQLARTVAPAVPAPLRPASAGPGPPRGAPFRATDR